MLHCLLLFLLLCFMLQDSQAQRRGRRNKGGKLEIMKNICCYFVNDNQLTKVTKLVFYKDALALSEEVLEKELGRKLEEEDTVLLNNREGIEYLAMLIYNGLVYLRLEGKEDLQELNALGIRKGAVYEDYKTNITLEMTNIDHWTVNYSLSFKEEETWQTKNWKIELVYCEFTYQITSNSQISIPVSIQQQALKRAAQEIKHQ